MKILYITIPSYFDLEISLIRELSRYVEIKVLMIVSPISKQSSAFNISELPTGANILSFNDVPELHKYRRNVDLNLWNLASVSSNTIKEFFYLSKKIRNFAINWRPDIIHQTTIGKCAFTLLPFLVGFKKILTLHDPIPHNKLGFISNLSRTLIMMSAKNLLFLSKAHDDKFVKSNPIKYYKIYHSKLGVYDFLNSLTSNMELPTSYVLFFGRIDTYKGVDLLINAYKSTVAYKKGIKLVIAGKGEIGLPENELKDPNIILYNRYIENSELADLIRNCLCVILPYRSATQSGCLMSAYAFNKPVIATKVGDFPTEIVDRSTGFLIEPNNEIEIINGIDQFFTNDDNSKMSDNIKKSYGYGGNNSWAVIAKKLYDIYLKL